MNARSTKHSAPVQTHLRKPHHSLSASHQGIIMQWLTRLRIQTRLALGFSLVLLGVALVAATGIVSLIDTRNRVTMMGTEILERVNALGSIESALKDRDLALRDLAGQEDPTEVIAEVKKFKTARDQYKLLRDDLMRLLASDSESVSNAKKLDVINTDMQKVIEEVINLSMGGNPAEAVRLVKEKMVPLQATMNKELAALRKSITANAQNTQATAQQRSQFAIMLMAAISGVVLLLGILLAWAIAKSVVTPIALAVNKMRDIAAGDLSQSVAVSGRDETATMMTALGDMQSQLRVLVSRVRESTQQINVASAEVATGNQDLSSRTEQQAASLQQTAASMGQMTTTIRETSDKAREADQLAAQASSVAARGGSVVSEVVSTMAGISQSSRKIADIIGVIDGIAFQTNILALNAAVEAARAGEQGRGFAVVASEVRTLAQRSAGAAKEIKALISESVERVESGTAHVDRAGKTMEEIVDAIQRVTALIADISAATTQQTAELDQINNAVSRMDDMTQQNAALVEQSAAAAASMQQQAVGLDRVVSQFKLFAT
jgi:methyl-accepting chemotaxis protein